MTVPTTLADADHTGTDDDLYHLYCCDENVALCGTDLTEVPVGEQGPSPMCVVCHDLNANRCQRCGWSP